MHAQGTAADLRSFLRDVQSNPPPAAAIVTWETAAAEAGRYPTFQIIESHREASPTVRISPDLAVCTTCLKELSDPADRHHQYPYINCTECGPRYSIIRQLPYDRVATTMAAWSLCPACAADYADPQNRRFHAQPTACPACGPGYQLIENGGHLQESGLAIRRAARLLREGAIVAIKGLGGYHLACDAANSTAIDALRRRKYRKEKPFAVIVRTLEEARCIAEVGDEHARLLQSAARPIVLAKATVNLPGVAPDSDRLGIMLPGTPLQHLLFDAGAPCPLVLTSGNSSSEPIAYRDDDARERLEGIADAFLTGERPIARRVDDSVVAVRGGQPCLLRRARGYSPGAIGQLPDSAPILALGSDLKNAVALVVDGAILVSQHIGDLGDRETDASFQETVHDLLAMYETDQKRLTVVHDLHPQFHSTRFAATLTARHHVAVQHHRAHVASVLAEHQLLDEIVVGVAFDGHGYGDDGSIWGGELFAGSLQGGLKRCTHLRAVRLPGGDGAARFPPQSAAAYLAELDRLPSMTEPPFCFPHRFMTALGLVRRNLRCTTCTSAGRLFDAVAALLGFVRTMSYEGQAATWLETRARAGQRQPAYPFPDFDHRPLIQSIIDDRLAGRSIGDIASAFHAALAIATTEQVLQLCDAQATSHVVLTGGVFQNELLLELVRDGLTQAGGLKVWTNRQVPANDGGISAGQAALVWGADRRDATSLPAAES